MFAFAPSQNTASVEKGFSSKLWTGLWVLFAISMFVSKSGISIFGTLLLLWSLFKVDWKTTVRQNPWFVVIASFFPLSILVSWLSIGGSEAAMKAFTSWSWPLFIIPFSVLVSDKKTFKVFGWALAVGLLLGCGKAVEVFATQFQFNFLPGTRVSSFWDIGRWGVFLSCSCVVLFALVGNPGTWSKASRFEKITLVALLVLSWTFLVMVNARGPWLAGIAGMAALGASGKRYFKCFLAVLVMVVVSWALVPGSLDRFKSSFSVKKENGVITSSDGSNAARLHMWKVAGDFFKEQPVLGTGFEAAEKPLREFLSRQSPAYINKYIDPEFSFNDQHNSYLWILVQLGVIFFLLFWGVTAVLMIKSTPAFFLGENVLLKMSYALIVNQLVVFVFYSSISSYETLWFFPMLWVLSQKNGRNK